MLSMSDISIIFASFALSRSPRIVDGDECYILSLIYSFPFESPLASIYDQRQSARYWR